MQRLTLFSWISKLCMMFQRSKKLKRIRANIAINTTRYYFIAHRTILQLSWKSSELVISSFSGAVPVFLCRRGFRLRHFGIEYFSANEPGVQSLIIYARRAGAIRRRRMHHVICIYTYSIYYSAGSSDDDGAAASFLARQTDPIYSSGRLHCRDSGPREIRCTANGWCVACLLSCRLNRT